MRVKLKSINQGNKRYDMQMWPNSFRSYLNEENLVDTMIVTEILQPHSWNKYTSCLEMFKGKLSNLVWR